MPTKTPLAALLILLALSFAPAHADEKLDRILSEIQSLRAQVAALEARLETVENQSAETAQQITSTAPEPRERKNWFDNMRVELKKAEVRASGAWTTEEAWSKVAVGMKDEEVIALLGEPTDIKFSVRKDTDEIYFYEGDLEGTGEPIEGEIRIYKGKVRRFVVPDFAAL